MGNNLNGGCDLKYLKDNVLGHANITAESHYPNQPVSDQPVGSATITKTVKSLFAKYLAVFPKGTTAELRNARIVVAHAQDIDGSPFEDELVCFSDTSPSGSIQAFVPTDTNNLAKKVGPYNLVGSHRDTDPINSQDSKRVCVRTNADGNAAIEVLESQGAEINIIGDFVNERLLRDVHVPFGEGTPSVIDPGIPPRAPGATPNTPAGPPAPNVNGNSTPSAATLAALAKGNVEVSSSRTRQGREGLGPVRPRGELGQGHALPVAAPEGHEALRHRPYPAHGLRRQGGSHGHPYGRSRPHGPPAERPPRGEHPQRTRGGRQPVIRLSD